MRGRRVLAAPLLALALLAAPASASGAALYVDTDGDDAANNCLHPAAPCDTLAYAISQAVPGDQVRIDDGTYTEDGLSLGATLGTENVSLLDENFDTADGSGPVIVDGDLGAPPTITVGPSGAGTISGLTIRGLGTGIRVQGPVSIVNNTFDETDDAQHNVLLESTATAANITGNDFRDDEPSDNGGKVAVRTVAAGAPSISGNSFEEYIRAVEIDAGSPQVTDNLVEEVQENGLGFEVSDATPTFTDNEVDLSGVEAKGFFLNENTGSGAVTGATLARNVVRFGDVGFEAQNTDGAITLNSDVFIDSDEHSLRSTDSSADEPGRGNLTVNNLTAVSNISTSFFIQLDNANLTMDSSALEEGTLNTLAIDENGTSTCTITFSFGPETGPGCSNFAYGGDSGLPTLDWHLPASSTLIDMGNPAAPTAPNDLDVDGQPRSTDGACPLDGARRDVGADESPALASCTPPSGGGGGGGGGGTTEAPKPKKCKKGQKLKQGKCVKKKRRKKKR